MLDDVRHLVMIESPSDSLEALGQLHAFLVHWVGERLGHDCDVQHQRAQDAPTATRWTVPASDGTRPHRGTRPFVALLGHYDTVWPLGTTRSWPFCVEGDRLSGPGSYDMKAGLVQMVWLVAALRHARVPHPAIRLVLSGDEEVGSAASRPFLERQCMGADAVLVFEGAIGDAVKTARKGIGRFVIDVVGVEAHAGVEPEKGASAIHELGSLIPRVLSIARAEEGTSVNIGVVSGGSRVNVTTARVRLELEARIRGSAEAARVESELEALAAADPRIRLEVRGSWERPVFERTASVAALYRRAERVAKRIDVPLREIAVGGASDGNLVAALGLAVLDGLGAPGEGAHARTESISIEGMLERTALAALLVASFSDEY
ncbi:peptidase M20 [Rathayibacter rathayi]|uniref:Peptidase M20 n=2 Tax=Rathayibacter rathayi TaxID=33887 RepID=A0ABX5ADP5_RATRA|nr:peptidase M20 [Rathayibacter rathayi]MWV74174.1 M20/M25/M40 family metallo-hydrolase [Rathayibacter rathayi NCPPB 2980 = VKM Ac-1601]PPF24059.1 peptidase M20 [Rathayibacter rathayi]PPF49010.1 peptidase M20 [Rathayibacter rathayi]PPF80110.1 peptidase M20 [Rathayibacter rathayi]